MDWSYRNWIWRRRLLIYFNIILGDNNENSKDSSKETYTSSFKNTLLKKSIIYDKIDWDIESANISNEFNGTSSKNIESKKYSEKKVYERYIDYSENNDNDISAKIIKYINEKFTYPESYNIEKKQIENEDENTITTQNSKSSSSDENNNEERNFLNTKESTEISNKKRKSQIDNDKNKRKKVNKEKKKFNIDSDEEDNDKEEKKKSLKQKYFENDNIDEDDDIINF
jgi:hypothetical protein